MAKTTVKNLETVEEVIPKTRRRGRQPAPPLATEEHLITTTFTVQKPVNELKPKPKAIRAETDDSTEDADELVDR